MDLTGALEKAGIEYNKEILSSYESAKFGTRENNKNSPYELAEPSREFYTDTMFQIPLSLY